MDLRTDFFKVLHGEKPSSTPMIFMGYWDEQSMHRLSPVGSVDEYSYCYPSDVFHKDSYGSEPRSDESRLSAIKLASFLQMATIGVGKGGLLPFGHGGPGEILPTVIERTAEQKILLYEGGHKRVVHYNPHSVHYYDFPLESEEDLETLVLPNMRDAQRFADVERDCELFKAHGFVPTGSIQGFFSGIHNSFMDFADTMANLLLEPEFMHQVTERLALMSLDAVDMFLERGVEVIDVCDDFGTRDGLIISPDLVKEFFLPWYEELADRVHKKGAYLHLHSHGNIAPLLADFAAIGIDIINPFDWSENPNLEELVSQYGDKIVFCGGSTHDQEAMSIEDRRFITERACGLRKFAKRGYLYMMSQPGPDTEVEYWQQWLEMTRQVLLYP